MVAGNSQLSALVILSSVLVQLKVTCSAARQFCCVSNVVSVSLWFSQFIIIVMLFLLLFVVVKAVSHHLTLVVTSAENIQIILVV